MSNCILTLVLQAGSEFVVIIFNTQSLSYFTTISFQVKPQEQKLLIQVFDENRLTRDDFLGMVEVPLGNVGVESAAHGRPPPVRYPLRPRRSV